eukprot:11169177-Alexandrium_andersonii.AAC.1
MPARHAAWLNACGLQRQRWPLACRGWAARPADDTSKPLNRLQRERKIGATCRAGRGSRGNFQWEPCGGQSGPGLRPGRKQPGTKLSRSLNERACVRLCMRARAPPRHVRDRAR